MLKKGKLNLITDVHGVKVGHCTIDEGDVQTGVTVILPSEDNPFVNKLVAATHVINGFGKTSGLVQIDELGQLESPIALTNTLSVGCVQDGLVSHMIERCREDQVDLRSINVVVGECNDSVINDIREQAVKKEHVYRAIEGAGVEFEQGAVGGGRGMVCHGLKGGIGSSSRQFEIGSETFTLGVLVQANHGLLEHLVIGHEKIGKDLRDFQVANPLNQLEEGSIIIVIATDLPLDARQLKRVCKRATVGLARVGSFLGNGSGDIVIAFTTANRLKNANRAPKTLNEGALFRTQMTLNEWAMDKPFSAVADATEEAIINALRHAESVGKIESLGAIITRKGK